MFRLRADRLVHGELGLRPERPRWIVRIRRVVVTLLCAFVIFSPKLAIADDATDARARARYQEGVRLFDAGKLEEAHEAFLDAYRLKSHPGVLRNLGAVEARLGRRAEAARHLARFLRESGDVAASDRADVEHKLADLERALGRLRFRVAPDGAAVSVDGEPVANAPIAYAYHVDPGSHVVRASADNRAAEEQTVVAEPGQVVDVVLELKAAASGSSSSAPNVSDRASNTREPTGAAGRPDISEKPAVRPKFVAIVSGVGLTVIATALAAVFYVRGKNAAADADDLRAQIRQQFGDSGCSGSNAGTSACLDLADRNEARASSSRIAIVSGVAAGGLAVTTVGIFLLWPAETNEHGKISEHMIAAPWVEAHSTGLVLHWSF